MIQCTAARAVAAVFDVSEWMTIGLRAVRRTKRPPRACRDICSYADGVWLTVSWWDSKWTPWFDLSIWDWWTRCRSGGRVCRGPVWRLIQATLSKQRYSNCFAGLLTPFACQIWPNLSNETVSSPHSTYATDSSCSAKSISLASLVRRHLYARMGTMLLKYYAVDSSSCTLKYLTSKHHLPLLITCDMLFVTIQHKHSWTLIKRLQLCATCC